MDRRNFLKGIGMAAAGVAAFGTGAFAKGPEKGKEMQTLENPRLAEMPDHNLPDGFERKHIYAEINGKEMNVATAFFFESGKSKANFISNDKHPECFSPKVDYQKVEEVLKKEGKDLVVAFAGAYRSPSGNIEGVAYENGRSVGEGQYSKWHGFVYINATGDIEMHRMKDAQNNFDQLRADALVLRAQKEGGSMYQQIPAIWNGVQKLNPTNPGLYEMRAICESRDGKKFVINCSEKITQDEFLKMCVKLKDENGNSAVYNLMLTDTGECSLATFKDKNDKNYTMVDEGFEQKGFTNVVVLSK